MRVSKTILIVDDDANYARALQRTLQAELPTILIDVEPDPEVAIWRVSVVRYNIVIVDLRMPVISGDMLARIITGTCSERPKILMISAYASDEELLDIAHGCGANSALSKPVDINAMVEKIEAWLYPSG